MNITTALVERTKAPASGYLLIRNDSLTGFGLRVTAGGARSFIFEGRIKGRSRRLTAGSYPAVTVLQARQRVLEIKAAIARGEDPAAARRGTSRTDLRRAGRQLSRALRQAPSQIMGARSAPPRDSFRSLAAAAPVGSRAR